MLLKGREGGEEREGRGRGQMGGAHESLLPGRVNALLIRCISHIAVGLPLFLRKERTILQSIAPDCTPGYTKSKAAMFWRGYKVSRIGHFCDCISLSFSYISFSSPGYPRRLPRQRRPIPPLPSKSIRRAHGDPWCFAAHGRARERGRSAVSRTNLHAVEDSHRGREKILPGMTKICK